LHGPVNDSLNDYVRAILGMQHDAGKIDPGLGRYLDQLSRNESPDGARPITLDSFKLLWVLYMADPKPVYGKQIDFMNWLNGHLGPGTVRDDLIADFKMVYSPGVPDPEQDSRNMKVTGNTTFTEICDCFWFALDDSRVERYMAAREEIGAWQLDQFDPFARPGTEQEVQNRCQAGKLVKQAIATEHGAAVAEAVFTKVTQNKGRNLENGVTCRDLNLLYQELPRLRNRIDLTFRSGTTTFADIYKTFKLGPHGSGESDPVCYGLSRFHMYAQNPFPDDSGNADVKQGAAFVSAAALKRYGWDATTAALNNVHEQTGRDVREKVTRGDLELIQRELVMTETTSRKTRFAM
jgi:hypothetical protein